MKSIKDVFDAFKKELTGVYEAKEIESLALLTLNDVCQLSNARIKAFPELELSDVQLERSKTILSQLKSGKPLQYILGMTEFYGLPFRVNQSVLIPRPETEELVQWVIESEKKTNAGKILDIGTGSGCIAISLKKNLPGYTVSAIDISEDALKTAKENAVLNDVDVSFIKADILNTTGPVYSTGQISKYDIVVSNPPYVTVEDKTLMHMNVTNFEPHLALFVPEDDPLVFYKAIVAFAGVSLAEHGMLFFEINENYGKETVDLLTAKDFKNIELRKDITGRERMIKATKANSGKIGLAAVSMYMNPTSETPV